ncbi:MAG: YajD family HNH nuclease [Desulfococcaceae bacterium]
MPQKKKGGSGNLSQVIAEQRKHQKDRENTYREKALKMFPWICGRCGREFEGKRLKELTVHHKDHNHDNNPPDGGNWELLCIYCHENEHARDLVADAYGEEPVGADADDGGLKHRPFEALQALLKNKGGS